MLSLTAVGLMWVTAAPVEVGIHIPKSFFPSAEVKADYLTKVEESLKASLGEEVVAQFRTDPSALADDQVWIVEPDAFAVVGTDEHQVVGEAQGVSEIALYLRKGHRWGNAFEVLTRGTVAVPGNKAVAVAWLRHWILMDDPESSTIAKRVKVVRDVRSALSSVEAGQVDAALVPQANYVRLSSRLPNVLNGVALRPGLGPLVVANTTKVSPALLGTLGGPQAISSLPTAPGASQWRAADAEGLRSKALIASMKKKRGPVSRVVPLPELGRVKMDLAPWLEAPPKPRKMDVSVLMEPAEAPPLIDPLD